MARQPRTPGATEAPKIIEGVVTPTADQVDATLDAILSTSETTEPTAEQKEYEEFLAWRNNKAAAPVAQHVPASSVVGEKRTRPVLGPNGWTTEEY